MARSQAGQYSRWLEQPLRLLWESALAPQVQKRLVLLGSPMHLQLQLQLLELSLLRPRRRIRLASRR